MTEFPLDNIYNVDETGLFPDHTMAFQKEDVGEGKLPKDRMTVLVGSSAVGEKLPLLVI